MTNYYRKFNSCLHMHTLKLHLKGFKPAIFCASLYEVELTRRRECFQNFVKPHKFYRQSKSIMQIVNATNFAHIEEDYKQQHKEITSNCSSKILKFHKRHQFNERQRFLTATATTNTTHYQLIMASTLNNYSSAQLPIGVFSSLCGSINDFNQRLH